MNKDIKYYLAGPMTGRPQFNYPLFDEVAKILRTWGIDITSPAEMDDPATRKAALASPDGAPGSGAANGETWGDFLSRDVKLIADTLGGIILLPEWNQSNGARLEAFVAINLGYPAYLVGWDGCDLHLEPVDAQHIMEKISESIF